MKLHCDTIQDPIEIELETDNAEFFANRIIGFSRPADFVEAMPVPNRTLLKNFLNLYKKAQATFNLDWDVNNLTQENFNNWHRFIETFDLSKYPPFSEEKGNLLHDLHLALHHAEDIDHSNLDNKVFPRTIMVKWFADSVPWPQPVQMSVDDLEAGDIIADYPHVGKAPWVAMKHGEDKSVLEQACKLPDWCPPGMVIHLTSSLYGHKAMIEDLKKWYDQNSDVLAHKFTKDEMLQYHGVYRLGRIKNPAQIEELRNNPPKNITISR